MGLGIYGRDKYTAHGHLYSCTVSSRIHGLLAVYRAYTVYREQASINCKFTESRSGKSLEEVVYWYKVYKRDESVAHMLVNMYVPVLNHFIIKKNGI